MNQALKNISLAYNAKDLAAIEMDKADGDVVAASEALTQLALGDPDVWRALTVSLLPTACYDACRAICHSERRAIYHTKNYDKGGNGGRVREHSKTLLDWPLPGGMKLKDAKKADLIKAQQFYARQARSMHIIATWLGAIAERVKRSTVGEKLTAEEVAAIRDTCELGVA